MDLWQTWEIDTIDEVDLVEYFINSKLKNETKLEISKEEIELIVFDFDGVMTNNKALLMENGQEGIVINRADGVGVSNLKKMGIPMLILTSEANSVVKIRAKKLKLEILANIEDKKSTLKEYLNKNKIDRSKTIYIGNDLNDLEVMKWVGYPICPADSHNRIKEISKIILDVNGGEGVTRTLFDILIN
jgi:YrbI family 3-deoxy-D-manno-octulosonate 8-phosphate phosphatase